MFIHGNDNYTINRITHIQSVGKKDRRPWTQDCRSSVGRREPLMRAIIMASLAALAAAPDEPSLRASIDREVRAEWDRQKLTPAPLAGDATFLRRVHLDLVGTLPSYEETFVFLKDADAGKRAKLVDRLLEDPRYASHQAVKWDLVLFGR